MAGTSIYPAGISETGDPFDESKENPDQKQDDTGFDWKTFVGFLGVLGNLGSSLFGNKQRQQYPTDTMQFTGQNTWEFIQDLVNKTNILNTNAQTNKQDFGEVTPTMSPQAQDFMTKLMGRFTEASKPVDITGIRQQGLRDINTSAGAQRQAVENIMASRGLGTSPISATSAANVENQRIGDINRFESGMPLLQSQLNTNNLGAAANFFASIPKGQTSTSGGTTSQVGQSSGFDSTSRAASTTGTQTGQDYRFQGTLPPGYWEAEEAKRKAALQNPIPV